MKYIPKNYVKIGKSFEKIMKNIKHFPKIYVKISKIFEKKKLKNMKKIEPIIKK